MNIGISTFPTDYSVDIAVLAKRAEEIGFESLWVPEHPILPVNASSPWPGSADGVIPKVYADIVDPFVALGRASAVTSTMKLGTGICLVPERNPLLLAKEVATLDMYSGGRFLFGIGAGWHKEETEIMGGDFPHRWTQTKESVLAMKSLWTEVESEYHGNYYDFPPVYSFPRPTQRPHPPVYLGGMARNVFKRVVEWGDGWMPNRVTPDDISAGRQKLNELASEAGRDPESINISVFGQPADCDLVSALFEAGADRVMIRVETAEQDATFAQLDQIAEEVLS
ncbi:MAG: LLM class F420-dependent oxidoreductase [Dehalococcoidia bacterium]|nr:LLM class F420-dependent oxidoreductase [Dehalococcoidia bacterium]